MYCFRFCIIFVTELIVTIMILKRISILNYKNLEQVELSFSPKLNCFFGQNGMGKTNLLDAVYFLSFCKSAGNPIDSQNICHDADFFVIQGFYEAADGTPEEIYCGMKRRQKKQFKRNKKEYTRLSDHIGFLPLVMVSPADSELIAGGSDERRRFMDVVISQYDKEYLDALIRYNKALVQRNTLLKSEQPVEEELFLVWEEMMAQAGEVVFRKREAFIREFIPIFQSFYSFISQDREKVGLSYDSHARDASLLEVLKESRARDQIMGYSLRGVHKDELNMLLGDFPIKRERGITIFSKQAVFSLKDTEVTLLDTPGHVDFSAEAERTLQVLDCAILVISGTDGVQAHTRTLWRLLERYHVPTFLFINKMDLAGADRSAVLAGLKQRLGSGCVDFSGERDESFREEAAVCDESVLERYLETGVLTDGDLRRMVGKRKLFPCWFGSALKLEGVSEFLEGVEQYAPVPAYPETFGARIYKIARDGQGTRLTYLKVTGG